MQRINMVDGDGDGSEHLHFPLDWLFENDDLVYVQSPPALPTSYHAIHDCKMHNTHRMHKFTAIYERVSLCSHTISSSNRKASQQTVASQIWMLERAQNPF